MLADNFSWTEAGSVWKGLIRRPVLVDPSAFLLGDDDGTDLVASEDVLAPCGLASTVPSTTPNIGDSGVDGEEHYGFAPRQFRKSWS